MSDKTDRLPRFPKIVIRFPRYEGSLDAAYKSFGENLVAGVDRWLRKLGGDPEAVGNVESFRDSAYRNLRDQVDALFEASRDIPSLGSDEERIERGQKLADDVGGLILRGTHAQKRKGAKRQHEQRDAEMWRLYRLEHFGSYAKIGLQFTPKMERPAVCAAIKRKDAEAESFRNLIFSLKKPLSKFGITLTETPPPQSKPPAKH